MKSRKTFLFGSAIFVIATAVICSGCWDWRKNKRARKFKHDRVLVYDDAKEGTKYVGQQKKKKRYEGLKTYRGFEKTKDIAVRCIRKRDGYLFKLLLIPKRCMWAKYSINSQGRIWDLKERGQSATFMYKTTKAEGIPPKNAAIDIRVQLPGQNKGEKGYVIDAKISLHHNTWDDIEIKGLTSSHEVIK